MADKEMKKKYNINISKLAIRQSLEQLEILKKALMQKYFGGNEV